MLIKITLTIIYSQFSLSPKLFSSLLDDHEDKQDATHTCCTSIINVIVRQLHQHVEGSRLHGHTVFVQVI